MTANGWIQILLFALVIFAIAKPMGIYMFRVFEGDRQPLPRFFGPIERFLCRLCGVDPQRTARPGKSIPSACCVFSAHHAAGDLWHRAAAARLAAEPAEPWAVPADLAFNTAASFTTNTNWQAYTGEVDHELSHADGGIGLAQLHLGGRWHRHRDGSGARPDIPLQPNAARTHRQFLGRSHPLPRSMSCCRSAFPWPWSSFRRE